MNAFVLDNSVSMNWLLNDGSKADIQYAENVLKSMAETEALIPNLWHIEAVNILHRAEKSAIISSGEVERFISQLENLPIFVDPLTAQQAFSRILSISRIYNLSSYDAAYLELAIREGLPLATLDKGLIKAGGKADVSLYLR